MRPLNERTCRHAMARHAALSLLVVGRPLASCMLELVLALKMNAGALLSPPRGFTSPLCPTAASAHTCSVAFLARLHA